MLKCNENYFNSECDKQIDNSSVNITNDRRLSLTLLLIRAAKTILQCPAENILIKEI